MQKVKLVVSLLIPLLVGILIYYGITTNIFSRWKLLTSPSIEELNYFVAAKTPDSFSETIQSCDYSKIEFSFLLNKPKNIVECVQSIQVFADGNGRITLVRDDEGNVWRWDFLTSVYNEIGALFWPVAGLIIGLIIMNAEVKKTKKIVEKFIPIGIEVLSS